MAQEDGHNKIVQQDGLRKVKIRNGTPEEREFAGSRKDDLDGLLRNGTFIEKSDIIGEPWIFGFRFFRQAQKDWLAPSKEGSSGGWELWQRRRGHHCVEISHRTGLQPTISSVSCSIDSRNDDEHQRRNSGVSLIPYVPRAGHIFPGAD